MIMRLLRFLKSLTEQKNSLTGWYNATTGKFLPLNRGKDEEYHHLDLVLDNLKAFGMTPDDAREVQDTTDLIARLVGHGWVRVNDFDGTIHMDVGESSAKAAVQWASQANRRIVLGIWKESGGSMWDVEEINLETQQEIQQFLGQSRAA